MIVSHSYIPSDYDEAFAVSARQILNGILECGYEIVRESSYNPYIKDIAKFKRVLVKKSSKKSSEQ